jgi:hypothetical protein
MIYTRFLTSLLFIGIGIGFASWEDSERITSRVNAPIVLNTNEKFLMPGHADAPVTMPGKQPSVSTQVKGRVGVAYGSGDSILYRTSSDGGRSFSASQLVASLPTLGLGMGRGPQITAAPDYTVITATNEAGNVFAYRLDHAQEKWSPATKINNVDTIAKEGFVAVASFQQKVLAVWLDLRGNRKNKVYGAWSDDGGKRWGKNVLVYQSPEGSICECCKISVVTDEKGRFYVMFRNNWQGARDLHLISSLPGQSFGNLQKLGQGTWVLQACPMDGGDISIDQFGKPVTVWRRKGEIFSVQPGQAEKWVGQGKTPSVSINPAGSFIVWQQEGDIRVITPLHPIPRNLQKGSYPQIRALPGENAALCAWEQEGKIILQRVE